MNIARSVTTPIVLGLILTALLIAALTSLTAECEFHQFDHLACKAPVLAGPFRSVYGIAWLLPVVCGGIGIWLLRQPARPAAQVVWSVMIVTAVLLAWAAFAFVALYTLHVASNYYL